MVKYLIAFLLVFFSGQAVAQSSIQNAALKKAYLESQVQQKLKSAVGDALIKQLATQQSQGTTNDIARQLQSLNQEQPKTEFRFKEPDLFQGVELPARNFHVVEEPGFEYAR